MSNSYKIEVKELSTWFGNKKILKEISCYFEDNSVTAVMGPSGCGKSTLLRSINRLNDTIGSFKMSGEVLLEGENIYAIDSDVYDLRRRVGMVFQQPNPFPMSVRNNITYGPKLHGVKDEEELERLVE
ncbi:MAG: phosphate ABC transporter ATP-binding protein, partial [Candidatus Thorarchaeota archaeon]